MSQILIEARKRIPGGKNANLRLRKAGMIPAVLYGRGTEPVAISVDPRAVAEIFYSDSGQNTIFSVSVDGGARANAMVKDYQLDPVHGKLIHADFMQIAMDRLLEISVDVELVGDAEGVKAGGLMDFVTRSIDIECLPGDIPGSIPVDVSHLQINDYVRVKNITVDPKIKVLTDPEVVIVTIVPPLKEAAPEEAPAEAAEPEVIKKGKVAEEGAEEEKKKEEE
ncbi:MAG: 50S ribosomal protein L25 [Acidobacteria bacterium]|nr:50S ribosomal protein L25 [Acidobacteriota bacterium]